MIQGNYIGVGSDGMTALGNGTNGVRITTESGHTIGGTGIGAGNVIAYNGGDGVMLQNSTAVNNPILGNSIYSNGGEGIDLGNNGITTNDTPANMDSDSGANGLQNFPLLTSANSNATGTTIVGSLNSNAGTTYRIEFFASRPSALRTPATVKANAISALRPSRPTAAATQVSTSRLTMCGSIQETRSGHGHGRSGRRQLRQHIGIRRQPNRDFDRHHRR